MWLRLQLKGVVVLLIRMLTAIVLLLACSLGTAHAHLRDYLVTQPYWTLPQGRFEMEIYNDFNESDSGETVYSHQTELEYGLTDRLTLGLYGVMEKKGAKPMEYAKTKFEGRYRLAEPGRMLVDPALYLEYQKGANNNTDKVEVKLLLSKDFANNMNITFNGILEKSRLAGSEWEKGYTAGVSKVINTFLATGIEIKNTGGKRYVIPGAYLTVVPGRMRMNVGAAFGLTDKSDDFQLKMLTEIEF